MDNKGFDDQDKVPDAKTKKQLEAELANNNNSSKIETAALQRQNKHEERMIMKNIIVISFAFMLLFTAFQSMAILQSSINKVSHHRPYNIVYDTVYETTYKIYDTI